MTKKNMMIMMIMSTMGGMMEHASIPKGSAPKPHWKETQTDEEREEKLRKAEEKRQRKLIKKSLSS